MRPALDKLNGVLTILDNRKERLQKSIKLLNQYAMSLGESVSSGPFFKTYVANLLPGQFLQPFIDAAFSDLGLDPNVLLPSERTDPQIGQPGTPALPVPFPRTGQGGEPHLTLPDAITGNPGDQGCGPPGLPLPGPPAATPTASRCPRRRPADRRRDRPRRRRPELASTPRAQRRARCSCPRRAKRRPRQGRWAREPQEPESGWPSGWSRCLVAGVVVLLRDHGHHQPHQRRRVLREQQRHLRRRRRAHPRRARRQDHDDRAAARAGQDHVLVRQQVQGACRREGRDPVADAGDLARHPAHARLHRRAGDGRRRRDSAGTHRGSRRVGRRAPAVGEADRHAAAHRTRRGQPAGLVHQHHRRQPARPGRQHPRHRHQAVAGVFGPR